MALSASVAVQASATRPAVPTLVGGPATHAAHRHPKPIGLSAVKRIGSGGTAGSRTSGRWLAAAGAGGSGGHASEGADAPHEPAAPGDIAQHAHAAAATGSTDDAPAQASGQPAPAAVSTQGGGATGGSGAIWHERGRWLAFGGSVAAVLALTVFRREIAPALRWLITQLNNLTDKSVLGEVTQGNAEAIATLAAVGLTLYWSFSEYAASQERLKIVENLETQLGQRLEAVETRLQVTEQRLSGVAAELTALSRERGGGKGTDVARAASVVDELAAELARLRREQGRGGPATGQQTPHAERPH